MGSLSLLQRILLTQESNQDLLHCRWILYQLSYQGKAGAGRNSLHPAETGFHNCASGLHRAGHVHGGYSSSHPDRATERSFLELYNEYWVFIPGGFPCGSVVKNRPANAGDVGSIQENPWRRK